MPRDRAQLIVAAYESGLVTPSPRSRQFSPPGDDLLQGNHGPPRLRAAGNPTGGRRAQSQQMRGLR